MRNCRVKIVGCTGYTGGELVCILMRHPNVEIAALTASRLEEPTPIHRFWPALRGQLELNVTKEDPSDTFGADVVFLGTPHGVSMELAQAYLDRGCVVIDLSADFRFKDPSRREGWYPAPHPPADLCQRAVYGMPELNRKEIAKGDLIACPGCYATSVILGLYPALKKGLIEPNGIHVSAASGVTGAGKNPKPHLHHPELDQNFFAYRVGSHQHVPEILDALSSASGRNVSLTFVPHVLPLQRGILATMFAKAAGGATLGDIREGYREICRDEPFIRLCDPGEAPTLHAVRGGNYLDIGLFEDKATGDIVILSAEDNLVKGAAGQAVQNLNIRMGFPETAALGPARQPDGPIMV